MNKKEILDKIKSLDNLDNNEKSYLIDLINTTKKYGLVWEEKPEDVEEELRTKLPIFKEVKERAIINDTETEKHPNHILIEGDNLHALTALSFTHQGKIDIIYIDPPYNTGNKAIDGTTDFKYNDDYVDNEDDYKHSKWLSFINKRLHIAKNLLAKDGFIAISIDDNEIGQLKILLDEIFNGNTKVIAVKMSEASGLKMSSVKKLGTIPKYKEYLLIAKPTGIKGLNFEYIPKETWDTEYNIYLENFDKSLYESILNLNERGDISNLEIGNLDKAVKKTVLRSVSDKHRELGITKKIDKEKWNFNNAWRICQCATSSSVLRLAKAKKEYCSQDIFFERSVRDGKLYFIRATFNEASNKPRVQLIFAQENLSTHPGDFWSDIKTTGLEAEGGIGFKNGKKPLKLLNRILNSHQNKNTKILDFFAGSGSTLHSAILLNNSDDFKREVILVTNNENNICENTTYIRAKNVINGYSTKSNSFPGSSNNNLRYYKCDFVPSEKTEKNRRLLTKASVELLCIKENSYLEITAHEGLNDNNCRVFKGKNKLLIIVFHSRNMNVTIENLVEFIKVENTGTNIKVYGFSPEKETLIEEFYEVADKIEAIPLPDTIYNAYKATFKTLKLHKN